MALSDGHNHSDTLAHSVNQNSVYEHHGVAKKSMANHTPYSSLPDSHHLTFVELLERAPWRRETEILEHVAFLEALNAFMNERGTPINVPPMLDSYEIDLRKLFKHVVTAGGLWQMIENEWWPKLTLVFNLPPSYSNRLLLLYIKYLYAFECFSIFMQEDNDIDYNETVSSISKRNPADFLEPLSEPKILISPPSSPRPRLNEVKWLEELENDYNVISNDMHLIRNHSALEGHYDYSNQIGGDKICDNVISTNSDVHTSHSQRKSFKSKNHQIIMDTYTACPKHPVLMTWRHEIEPIKQKISVQDYTKTPIPKISRRLMARHNEGLLMHRLELASLDLRNSKSSAALNALLIKSWDPTFNITLYPPVMEQLIAWYMELKKNFSLPLRGSGVTLFNTESDDESDLSCLARIASIFRNLSQFQHNQNIIASHVRCVESVCHLITLDPFLGNEATNPLDQKKDKKTLVLPGATTISSYFFKNVEYLIFNDNMKQFDHETRAKLLEIRFSAMEVLSSIAHTLKLNAGTSHEEKQIPGVIVGVGYQASRLDELSECGRLVVKCLPLLIDIACSPAEKLESVFLAVEILGKFALNANSRPMWLSLDYNAVVNLFFKMLLYAMKDDNLSELAIFTAYQISQNGINLPIAQTICQNEQIIEHLVLLCNAQNWHLLSKSGEDQAFITYKRYSIASKAAAILHKLVSFIPIRHLLGKFEELLFTIFTSSSDEIANHLKSVLVQY